MSKKIRLLISSRDPGSAAHIVELARFFREDGRFDITMVASGVAYEILSKVYQETVRFVLPNGADHIEESDDRTELLEAAAALIQNVEPDGVFVGLSSLGCGVDEALLAKAGERPTFAFQDFWGDVNQTLGVKAGLYFVFDEYAVNVTRERWKAKALGVGSPKHSVYASLDVDDLGNRTRARLGIPDGRKVVGFFSQTSQVPGHEDAFIDLANAVGGMDDQPIFLIREHAKFPEDRESHLSYLKRIGLDVLDVTDEPRVEPLLTACDVVSTCYSSCALDHAYLSAYAREPIGTTVFLLTNPDIRSAHMKICGFPVFPTVTQGIGLVARSFEELGEVLDTALGDDTKKSYHSASKKLSASFSPRLITDTVAAQITESRNKILTG